ncbi:MAG: histidine--tRNA ligase [Candidatus Latescibacteria bacterium]|nr:histidine--tRNA ligase [Candidatus Latescibacterota bacterium]
MKKISAVRGAIDILPGEIGVWQRVETVVRDVMTVYGYNEIRTPLFEETALFARSIGEDTDIVGKEMYTFADKGGRSLTLRPEGTASVVRAFIEHSLDQRGLPQALWYMGPMFRQERPQKGRQRQFHQFGVELIGSTSPAADAEVMLLFDRIAAGLGLDEREFSLHSIGGMESRNNYRTVLVDFLDTVEDRLCVDCRRRKGTNPLRVLDCKKPGCREAVHDSSKLPKLIDSLTDADREHYESVKGHLDDCGVSFVEDRFLVRGFDYYTGTVFEMNCKGLGAQSAVMGGGRYDDLVRELGGQDQPAVGFACGMERLVLVMREAAGLKGTNAVSTGGNAPRIYVVSADDAVRAKAMRYLESIRGIGCPSSTDLMGRSMKAQMKAADRFDARIALIVEPDGSVSVRDMEKSEQRTMPFDLFLNALKDGNIP